MPKYRLSRRNFVHISAGAAAATFLGVRPVKAAPPVVVYYWDQPVSIHDQKVAELKPLGYRLVSISMSGVAAAVRITALWIQRTGPAWEVSVVMPLSDVTPVATIWAGFGYNVTKLAATGAASDPRFIMVVEQGPANGTAVVPELRHVVPPAMPDNTTIEWWLNWAFGNNEIPVSIAQYGGLATADVRYALVMAANPNKVHWNLGGLNEETIPLSRRNSAQELQRGRNALVAMTTQGRYMTLYRADELIHPTRFRHDLTPNNIDADIETQKQQDYYPIQIAMGGTGASRRFGVTYVKSETVLPRQLNSDGAPRSSAVDQVMIDIMVANKVRQAGLAVVKNKKLVYARAFTLAEAGYPIAAAAHHFRVGSCCKTFTAMLIMTMVEREGLPLNTPVQNILQLRTPTGGLPTENARWNAITIEQLLTHRSGLGDSSGEHFTALQHYPTGAMTRQRMAQYIATKTVPFATGTFNYSNDGYLILALVIDRVVGSYINSLRARILTRLDVSRMRSFSTAAGALPADEARSDSQYLDVGQTVVARTDQIVPRVYGGVFDPVVWDATGGMTMSLPDAAKVLASFSKDGAVLNSTNNLLMLNNRFGFDGGLAVGPGVSPNGWKNGETLGASAQLHVVRGGTSFIVAFNKMLPGEQRFRSDFPNLQTAVNSTAWPASDLFPTFGIDSFP